MSTNKSPIDAWLTGLNPEVDQDQAFWDPGFDSERRLVVAKLGPYQKLFERPQQFTPRFYHRIYPMVIEDWYVTIETRLYGGFCTMATDLHIHFQPTLKYAQRNMEVLSNLNQQIKTSYEGLLKDIVNAELRNLDDGDWVHTGLNRIERQIEVAVNEALIVKHIQCRTICVLTPAFEEISDQAKLDDRFIRAPIYLNVLQKNFEFREKQRQELFRQEEELELLRLAHEQKQFETINQEDEIQRQKQALEAEAVKRQLEEQEAQRVEQYAIEVRLYMEKINHETQLKEIEFAAELEHKKHQQIQQQQLELEMKAQQFEHERLLREQERSAEIKAFEQQRSLWLQAKEQEQRLKQLELEAELKEQERLETEKINYQIRLNELQLGAELKTLELRTEATKNKDEYLRREIEWLVLDKQRAELTRAIRAANQDIDDANR